MMSAQEHEEDRSSNVNDSLVFEPVRLLNLVTVFCKFLAQWCQAIGRVRSLNIDID